MAEVTMSSLYEDYWSFPRLIHEKGIIVEPRGRKTYELPGPTTVHIRSGSDMPRGCGRGVVLGIGVVEALQLIGGVSAPDLLVKVAPAFKKYMEKDPVGQTYQHGAYGPRAAGSLPHVIDKLLYDEDTRQALTTIWAQPDLVSDSPDIPCTVALTFQIRRGMLEMITTMRSNDVWLGFPYDVFQFRQLQLTVARCIGRAYGMYHHTAFSMHLYADDENKLDGLHEPDGLPFAWTGIGDRPCQSWRYYADRARQILEGELPQSATDTEWHMHKIVKQYL